jgi:formylglycine-generating enzyme required for sulfatase activity/serine/threonine protein kinase
MSSSGSSSAFANALTRGTKLANYEIRRVLGAGAFGITYLAKNSLGQQRTIKEFFPAGHVSRDTDGAVVTSSPDGAETFEQTRERFKDEAKIIVGLDHPNIVKGLDFFDANNTAYFVMPYYDGSSLDHFVVSGDPLEPAEAQHLLDRMWSALEHLHARDIFHRDIKPANIFIVSETGEPILLDFGAARIVPTGSQGPQTRVGSDHYRAPEQTSENGETGPWTDIYGLSATLYRLISGRLPVDAATRMAELVEGKPDTLTPLAADAALSQQFGKPFLAAIDAGMAVKRQDRPASISAWRALFKGASKTPPVQPSSPSPSRQPNSDVQPVGFEPEGTPWIRYGVLGFILAAIFAGGIYLASQSFDLGAGKTAEPKTENATPVAEEEKPEPVPAGTKRLTRAEAWVKALETDTLQGYREYLSLFSTGENADKARVEIKRFDDEAYAGADRSGTMSAYQSYLDQFPNGAHVAEARAAMQAIRDAQAAANARARQEVADWRSAAATNTAASYQAYLDKHPTGKNAPEARSRLDNFAKSQADTSAFRQAENLGTKSAYQTYLNSYPQGNHVPAAMAAIDKLTPRVGGQIKDCANCPPLTIVASGGFQQGAGPDDAMARSNEKPERRVDFAGVFAIGVKEVTFAEWDACVSGGGCSNRASDQGWGRGDRPVINISWNDAKAYTDWLSRTTGETYSLPSESQWEYAARAGEIRPWLGGSTKGVCAFANGAGTESGANWANTDCSDPAGDRTMPVGSLAANKFGLKDVLGNVAEWTMDCNTLNYRDAPSNGGPDMRGSCRQRVTRGGSWFSGPRDLRLSSRAVLRQDDSNDFTGFRVVRTVKQ